MEDCSSWIHGYANANATGGNNGFMCGYAASCSPVEFQQQQQLISMQMGMDDESAVYDGASMVDDLLIPSSSPHHAGAGSFQYSSSTTSSSASFRSASVSCSPESSAAATTHFLGPPASAAAFHYPEVSSQAPLPLPLPPYEPQHGQYTVLSPPPPELPATVGAFRRYARHLRPRRLPKPGACGQRMFKTAMSVLTKMHVAATYNRQYYYQQAVAAASASAAEAAAAPPSGNQLQHMISERKRREKLNDSFLALKAVLPPGSKKDKTSILIRAREYVKSLESKLSELEEKNRELEARLASRPAAAKNDKGEMAAAPAPEAGNETKREDLVEIEVTTTSGGGATGAADAAAAGGDQETSCTLNVDLRGGGGGGGGGMSTTDVVLRTLQCLREQIGDGASLVAMSTSAGSGGRPPRANLTLQLKV
uniref:BHLH domain-containing protein n=1 Tax=Oryza meridionalis TaxID=40149 RepID=A0A0E0BYL0_9ORYZ